MASRSTPRQARSRFASDGLGWFYGAAALLGAVTLTTLLTWYPYDNVQESVGKFFSTGTTIAGLLCLATLWQQRPTQVLSALTILIGAAGVAWASSFTALPDPPAALGDADNDLTMVAAGFAAGGALGLLFTVMRGEHGRTWAHVPLIFSVGALAILTAITLMATAPDSLAAFSS